MPSRNQPVYRVSVEFPPPRPDDHERRLAVVKQMYAMGREVVAREDKLIADLCVALEDGNTESIIMICRALSAG